MVLVTGATGHLGANLVRRLLDDGHAVRVLLQPNGPTDAVDGLDVERIHGDIRFPASVAAAIRGCERVYHCAAKISTLAGEEREIYESNVIGTRNVLRAALDTGVSRVVVSGSLSAVGHDPNQPSVESMPFYPFDKHL